MEHIVMELLELLSNNQTHIRSALDFGAVIEHQPGIPTMAIDNHRVPLVQHDGLSGSHAAHAGAAIEPELHEALVQQQGHKIAS